MLAIFLVEPYKRRKLAQALEGRLLEGEAQNTAQLAGVIAGLDDRFNLLHSSLTRPQTTAPAQLSSAANVEPKQEQGVLTLESIPREDVYGAVAAGIVVALLGKLLS